MKFTVAVLLALAAVCFADDKYTTKYDNLDVDEILKSDRLFKNYYNCLLDKGKCSPEARELKRVLPDALQTECSKCSERQRTGTDKVLRHLIENKPAEWKELSAVYDPQNIYITKYRAEAEKRGIKLPN